MDLDLTLPAVLPPCQISSLELGAYGGGEQHLAILFYPYDFLDPYFQELRAFADKYQLFKEIGCKVIYIFEV